MLGPCQICVYPRKWVIGRVAKERSILRTSIGGEGKQRSRKVLPCNNGRTPTIRGEAPLIPSGQWLDENERVRQSCIPYLAGHLRVRQRCRDNALWEKRAFQWRHVRLPAADCQGSTRPIVTHGRGVLAARAKGLLLSTLLNGAPCQPPCFGMKAAATSFSTARRDTRRQKATIVADLKRNVSAGSPAKLGMTSTRGHRAVIVAGCAWPGWNATLTHAVEWEGDGGGE